MHLVDHRKGGPVVEAGRVEAVVVGHLGGADLAEAGEQLGGAGSVPSGQLEEQPFVVGRHLDVHGGAGGGHHRPGDERTVGRPAREDVVAVGPDHELIDGQAHLLGDPPGEDVAEVARRHRERAPTQPSDGGDVVDDLGHHPGPVDGVHGRQAHLLPEGHVGEERLHEVLAVVEGALDGDVVDVRGVDRRHLATLHVAHPTGRVEHHDVEPVAAHAGLDGGGAGVAGGGNDDGGPLVTLLQHVVEEPADELQGHVLERQRRTPEQLEQVELLQLHQRAHVGVVEGGVGLGHHGLEHISLDGALDEGPHDVDGDGGVGPHLGPHLRAEGGPGLGNVEPTIGSQSAEQHVGEAEHRSRTARGDVVHQWWSVSRRRRRAARSRSGRQRRAGAGLRGWPARRPRGRGA